jgi:hypothetical protein
MIQRVCRLVCRYPHLVEYYFDLSEYYFGLAVATQKALLEDLIYELQKLCATALAAVCRAGAHPDPMTVKVDAALRTARLRGPSPPAPKRQGTGRIIAEIGPRRDFVVEPDTGEGVEPEAQGGGGVDDRGPPVR